MVLAAALVAARPGFADTAPLNFTSTDTVLAWVNRYREHQAPGHVAEAIVALSRLGGLKDPESSGVYVGFLAGILHSNPASAGRLITRLQALPFEDQWVLVRAIAYSGLPDWRQHLTRLDRVMPKRHVLIERYLTGTLPTLAEMPLEKKVPGTFENVKNFVTFHKPEPKGPEVAFENSPELLDTLWGFYFATGSPAPVKRIITLLPWSKDNNSIERLTIGSMAKFTLATNASRSHALLVILHGSTADAPKDAAPVLTEVIEAAETVDTARLRKDALAALEDLKRKGPGYKRDMALYGQIGEGAISAGCLAAAVVGQVALGLPCVIGGAVSSAALHYVATPN
jgi:hypothetical protein